MKVFWQAICLFFTALFFTGCVKPYEPPVLEQGDSYLVVEGHLTSGSPTTILLSRTLSLSNKEAIKAETAAMVTVESQSGTTYALQETASGAYTAELDLSAQEHYRLNIKTQEGKQYLSEYVPYKNTPPIDALSWVQKDNDAVYILANTSDPQNNTWYYRWEYEEDWEWRVPYPSKVEYVRGEIIPRTFIPELCWGHENSKSINIASSLKYGNDIIKDHVVTIVPYNSWKISSRYSILVRQYAISRQAYEYYQQIKKNAEELGSLFDPQPVELAGNIYSVDSPTEPVVGFFGAGSVQQHRIFIDHSELDNWVYHWDCNFDPKFEDVKYVPMDKLEYFFNYYKYHPYYHDLINNVVVAFKNADCTDCTQRAKPVKPDFWE
jgi:hypothetical protein